MKFQMKSTAKAVALGIVTLAASAAFATQTPVEFDLKGHDEFVKSLGKDAIAPQQRTAEESKAILAKVYNEKLEQHVSSFHYEKGVTCISCHDQQKQGGQRSKEKPLLLLKPDGHAVGDAHVSARRQQDWQQISRPKPGQRRKRKHQCRAGERRRQRLENPCAVRRILRLTQVHPLFYF